MSALPGLASSALAWLGLAAALLLVPAPAAAAARAQALAGGPPRARRRPGVRWPGRAMLLGAAAAGAIAVVTAAGGAALGVAAAVAGLVAARLITDAGARRRRGRGQRELLAAVCLLVAELESGSRPGAALGAAADAAPEHADAFRSAAEAAADAAAVGSVLLEDPALAGLGHAWSVATRAGVPLADVLSGVAADLASRVEQGRAVAVALSAARSTAALLAGLPLVGVALGTAMGARPLTFLTQSPAGRLVCCAGVVLDALGLLWTQRLARRAEVT
ncbi:MAG: secretion system protein [Jatrophihabitantaceae bacterium]